MKKSTTIILLVLTAVLAAWMLLHGNSGPRNVDGYLLFDWSDRLAEKGEVGVDIDPADVAGIDLKSSSGDFSLRKQPDNVWEVSGGVKDRADDGIVKELLSYCTKARIKDTLDISEVKDGKVSAASLGLDDAGAWRVTWLKADGGKLGEVRIGRTTPLEGASYVQVAGQDRRPDIYFVTPDLRPLLARPPDSFRDPRVSRYPSEVLVKMVVRKGEGEVEFSRTFQQVKPAPGKSPAKSDTGKNVIEVEPTPWVISRPLQNAPADQEKVKNFTAMICGAKVEAWVPYNEAGNAGEKPLVEVTLVPAGANAKGVTLSFFKDPADPDPAPAAVKPGAVENSESPAASNRMAVCRDPQRKVSFKVPRDLVDDLCVAESPTFFRSTILAAVDPAIVSTIRIEQSSGVSVEVVRVRDRWYWRPLNGTSFEDAAPEAVEKLISLLNSTEILEFPSDSLSDLAAFGLDKPVVSITIAAGMHLSLDKLTPVDNRNSQTLRIGITEPKGRVYANFTRDPFVFRIGPELPSGIPLSYFKWRSLTLPGFSMQQVRSVKQTIGPAPPLVLHHEQLAFDWTAKRGEVDVTPLLNRGAIETLVLKAGSLQAVAWWDSGPGAAQKALELPSVRIEVQFDVYDEKPGTSHVGTLEFEFAPMPSANAPYCFGRISGRAEPFIIQREVLNAMAAPLLKQ